MKKIILLFLFVLTLIFPIKSLAASDYTIDNFQSTIEINQDASLTVTETITANFLAPKHGIFRFIPTVYSANGKTINAKLKLISITNENNQPYPYTTSRLGQSVQFKIGNPIKTITGRQTYVIKYNINEVLLRYSDHDEVYWNVTGHEWDTTINKASAIVKSPYATITEVKCFDCQGDFKDQQAVFSTQKPQSPGQDFTVVVALDKNNQLNFPGPIKQTTNFIADNWGYPLAILPFLIMLVFWYLKGRDIRFLSDNVFYQLDNQKTGLVSPFRREHLPMVYAPIDNISPSQVGTIIDEKVDLKDVVAEIVELARLRFIEIKKEKKDYLFIKKNKNPDVLKDYQKYLFDSLFADNKTEILLSKLKNKFYLNLANFKKTLYQNLTTEKIFSHNPEKTRILWIVIAVVLSFAMLLPLLVFSSLTFNYGPLFLLPIFAGLSLFTALKMPRRTAWGHSLYRQTVGLRWYLNKGKWREEIAEKNLFFEEILPLAICLGLVTKLAKEMTDLGVAVPSYFTGMAVNTFAADFNHFYRNTTTNLVSSPQSNWSGHSSWSGGSGFSGGGSSGGGFGGGGGGSW